MFPNIYEYDEYDEYVQGSPQQLQQLKVQRQLQLFQKQSVGGSQRVALQPVAGGKVSTFSGQKCATALTTFSYM